MKKLRNKKTGEIVDGGFILIPACTGFIGNPAKSVTEVNDTWEDYKPAEPLIDNEEIREIIRAWADVNDAGKLKYIDDENSLNDIYRNTISFNRGLGLEDGEEYTIAELCGEEEAPEPLEPTFIDLDERIKDKEEECES